MNVHYTDSGYHNFRVMWGWHVDWAKQAIAADAVTPEYAVELLQALMSYHYADYYDHINWDDVRKELSET